MLIDLAAQLLGSTAMEKIYLVVLTLLMPVSPVEAKSKRR